MKRLIWLGIGVSCLASTGNAQDSADAGGSGLAATAYTTQGSAAYNQTLRDAEQRRRVEEARQLKAIKSTMRTINPEQIKYTTAEQYLAANRPPMPPPVDPAEQARIRRDSFVPEFEGQASTSQGRSTSAPPPVNYPRPDLPEKRNFFKWLAAQNGNNSDVVSPVNSGADLMTVEALPLTASPGPVMSEQVSGEPQYVQSSYESPELPERGNGAGLFGKFFGGKKESQETTSDLFDDPVGADDLPPEGAMTPESQPDEGGGLPDPPAFTSEAPANQPVQEFANEQAPIFARRDQSASGTPVKVTTTTQAEVEGVRVMLYEGTTVNLISRSGGNANIQLPDGRTGVAELSALSQ